MGKKATRTTAGDSNRPETALALMPETDQKSPFVGKTVKAVIEALRNESPEKIHELCAKSNLNLAGAELRVMFLAHDIKSRQNEYIKHFKSKRGLDVCIEEIIRWSGIPMKRFHDYANTVEVLNAINMPLAKLLGCPPDRLVAVMALVNTDDQDGVIDAKKACAKETLALLDPTQTDDEAFTARIEEFQIELKKQEEKELAPDAPPPTPKPAQRRAKDRFATTKDPEPSTEVASPKAAPLDTTTTAQANDTPNDGASLEAAIADVEQRFGVNLFSLEALKARYLFIRKTENPMVAGYYLATNKDEAARYAGCDEIEMQEALWTRDTLWAFLDHEEGKKVPVATAEPVSAKSKNRKLKTDAERNK